MGSDVIVVWSGGIERVEKDISLELVAGEGKNLAGVDAKPNSAQWEWTAGGVFIRVSTYIRGAVDVSLPVFPSTAS